MRPMNSFNSIRRCLEYVHGTKLALILLHAQHKKIISYHQRALKGSLALPRKGGDIDYLEALCSKNSRMRNYKAVSYIIMSQLEHFTRL